MTILTAAFAALPSGPLRAQSEVAFEVGASQVGPPAGVDRESARFGMAGVRASHYTLGGSGISASLMLGRSFGDTTGGDFVSGVLSSSLRDAWGTSWTGGFDLEVVGFEIRAPFPYRALALEGGPSLSLRTGPVTATATGTFGVGRSRVELWRRFDGIHRVFSDDLWRAGTTGELLLGTGTVRVGVAGGVHDTPSGGYRSGGARLVLASGWAAAEVRADVWHTPLGNETTGGLTFVIPLSSWSVRGFFGKSEPDPLTLAEPGSGSGGLLLSVNLYSTEVDVGEATALPYEVVSETPTGARTRIRLDGAAGARSVALLGDFTLWEPLPMARDGDGWVTEVDVTYGTHHYGFLVDDEWHVPDDTVDVVPDEWGRLSAILVIEE